MTAIAVFVKTPGYSPIKTRLATTIGKEKAEAFFLLSCNWVEQTLKGLNLPSVSQPFWAVAEKEALDSSFWANFKRVEQGEGDFGERLYRVYDHLLLQWGSAIVLGADSPELSADVVEQAVRELNHAQGCPFVFGGTTDGGFYLFGGKKTVPREIWTSVTYSQNTTGEEFKNKIAPLGKIKELPICADVDTLEDLTSVMTRLKKDDPSKYSALLALDLI